MSGADVPDPRPWLGPMPRSAEFEALIRAEPMNRNHQHAYADWLQEQGDVRGEWVAAHLAKEDAHPLVSVTTLLWIEDVRPLREYRGLPVYDAIIKAILVDGQLSDLVLVSDADFDSLIHDLGSRVFWANWLPPPRPLAEHLADRVASGVVARIMMLNAPKGRIRVAPSVVDRPHFARMRVSA